jgi:HlyD family secretion protein
MKNRRLVTIVVVLALVAGAIVGYLRFAPTRTAAQTATANLNTATAQVGTLTATVNTAGNIAPAQQVALNFGQSGTVSKVDVQVGQSVKAGDVLAELDATALNLAVQNAQVSLKNAQDNLAKAKNPNTTQDIANARSAVDAAQANYNKLVAGASSSDIAAAQQAVASAQAAYDAAVKSAGTTGSQLEAAAAAAQKAQVALQQAQAAYDKVATNPNIGMLSQSVTLQQATIDYQSAMAQYQQLQTTSASSANSQVQSAKSQLEQAKANLTKLQNQVTQNDVVAAQATVTQAKNNLDKLLAGSDANTLDLAQNAVDQAQIALKQAQYNLQQAQIVAPFDGVVTAVNITASGSGSAGGNSGAVQLADLKHLQIVVSMAEVDVAKAKVGQAVQITLDALPNQTFQGKVSQIAPSGTLTQGVVNYPVTITLDNPSAAVMSGMTASANIVTQQKANVLMVPNRAVRTQGRQKVVTVLFEGQQIQTPVQTGMNNDTMTEITGGLQEGDVVLLNGTTTAQTRVGGGGGFGVPGVGGFGR